MDSLHIKKRSANITSEQRTLLIEYMRKHPELIRGKFSSTFTLKDSINLWKDVTDVLNAMSGANKDWKGWRKCWDDFQSKSKKKHTAMKQAISATGGGVNNAEILTPEEEQVLDIMCPTSVNGHPDIFESNVNLLEDLDNDSMEVEYLNEYEEEIQKIIQKNRTDSNSTLSLQKQTTVTDKEFKSQELIGKENVNNNRDLQQPAKIQKFVKEVTNPLNNEQSYNLCARKRDKVIPKGKKMTSAKHKLENTIEVSSKWNDICEKTYNLKKAYYEARLEYLKRSVEANEKMANIMEMYMRLKYHDKVI